MATSNGRRLYQYEKADHSPELSNVTVNEDQALRILGLERTATSVEINQAYRDLAKVWHPDRFPNDPRLQEKAQETLKRINEAYQIIQGRRAPRAGHVASAPETSEFPVSDVELDACGVSGQRLQRVQRGMQLLIEAGLAPEDIADRIHSSVRVLDALAVGDYKDAKRLCFEQVAESLTELRATGVPDEQLWVLGEEGIAVGEIAWAIRNIRGLRDELTYGDSNVAKQCAQTLHDFFQKGGRTTRRSPRAHRVAGVRSDVACLWEQYLKLAQKEQNATQNQATKPEYQPETAKQSPASEAQPAAPSIGLNTAQQFLLIAAAMGLAILVGLVANPGTHIEHPWLLAIVLVAVFASAILFIARNQRSRHGGKN